MVFEIQQLSQKVPLFQKSMNSTLNRFPKGKFQEPPGVYDCYLSLQSLVISTRSMLK